jgi:hypothetical protein
MNVLAGRPFRRGRSSRPSERYALISLGEYAKNRSISPGAVPAKNMYQISGQFRAAGDHAIFRKAVMEKLVERLDRDIRKRNRASHEAS